MGQYKGVAFAYLYNKCLVLDKYTYRSNLTHDETIGLATTVLGL